MQIKYSKNKYTKLTWLKVPISLDTEIYNKLSKLEKQFQNKQENKIFIEGQLLARY